MRKRPLIHPKTLLVEGNDDRRVIPELMEKNGITWEPEKGNYIVEIQALNSIESLLDPDEISTQLKATSRSALGLIIDADTDPPSRWKSIRNVCQQAINNFYETLYPDSKVPDFPETLPETGLIHSLAGGIKLGVWMMPDNQMRGMLETYLGYLIPTENEPLWSYTKEVVEKAKDHHRASFKDVHKDKALIHTWLAWQEPPGRQLHDAVKFKILDPKHPKSKAFVDWFKLLYL